MQFVNNLMNYFINSAQAATATPPPQQASGFSLTIMTAIFILFMYFIMWRPQSKKAKEQRNLLTSLSVGDEVVTAGGVLGRITKIMEAHVILNLADKVDIIIQKSAVVTALPKGTLKAIS